MFRGRSLRTEPSRKTCSPGLRERRRGQCRGPCGLCSTPPDLEEAPDAARLPKCSSVKKIKTPDEKKIKNQLIGVSSPEGYNHKLDNTESYLIPSQNFERGYHLVGRVRVGGLAGHEVDEGLEGDEAHPVGIHYAHDAGELTLPLVVENSNCDAQGSWRQLTQQKCTPP